jgi:flagellar biosynthesis GTPase FlhF
MPAVRTAAKRTMRKTRKVTMYDVWATIERNEKAHEEFRKTFERGLKEIQEARERELKEREEARERELKEREEARERELKENREAREKSDKKFEKLKAETWKAIKENQRAAKEMQRNIGGLNNTLGSLVEHIMTPSLPGKFKEFGFTFETITTVKWSVGDSIYAEIDGLVENGEEAMVVEVKTKLRRGDIDEHLERMGRVRAWANRHGDKRNFLGAMAAAIADESTKNYALEKGFFLIQPAGKDVKVTQPDSGPRIWAPDR